MSNKDQRVRIDLTPAQQQEIKGASGRDTEALELTIDALEDRVAPSCCSGHHYATATITA